MEVKREKAMMLAQRKAEKSSREMLTGGFTAQQTIIITEPVHQPSISVRELEAVITWIDTVFDHIFVISAYSRSWCCYSKCTIISR